VTRYFLNSSVEVLVASYGGVGTTFLSQAIGRFQRVNDPRDLDGYKHCPVPPVCGVAGLKVVYVVGNPILAAASLFRRGYQAGQAGKLQYSRIVRRFPKDGLVLKDYAAEGNDLFLFHKHFEAWTKEFVFYPTLVVKYEAIHDSLPQIAKFLNLPAEFLSEFPPLKERGSDIAKIDPETLQGLEIMYGNLARKIQSLPNISEIAPSASQAMAIFDRRYWIGAGRDLFWKGWRRISNGGLQPPEGRDSGAHRAPLQVALRPPE
jgi:hypothetical protein